MTKPLGRIRQSRLRAARRRGAAFALVIVLLLVVLLAVTVSALTIRTSGGYRLARSRAEGWKLYYAGRSAIEEAKAKLWREYTASKKTPGIAGAPKDEKFTENGVDVVVKFDDEAGKIPVNDFFASDDARKKELEGTLSRLFESLDIANPTGLAASVRDYIDQDTSGDHEQGAINRSIFDVSELVGAQGFSNRILFTSKQPGILPCAASCITPWYTGNININSAPPLILKAMEPTLTDSDVARIIAARKNAPFTSAEDFTQRAGVTASAAAPIAAQAAFTTDMFTLRIEAREGEFVRRMESVVWTESSGAHTSYIRDGWQEQEVGVAGLSGN